ncbi:MAG: hypothetical protein V4450_17610 [Bacteroidota bacterium]
MKLPLLLLFVLSVTGITHAQSPPKRKDNGIYLSYQDYLDGKLTQGFNKADGVHFLENKKHSISIKTRDSTYRFHHDETWGYRENNIDWRIWNEECYRIEYTGKICLYTLPGCLPCYTSATLYFSNNITTALHPLTRKNLVDVYHANTLFVQKIKKLPLTVSLEKLDKETKQYRFISWL